MSLLKKIAGALLGLVVVIVGAGFLLPSHVHVEREMTINAAPAEVFALVSDFEAWDAWSPWAKIDPEAEMTITGSGIGQKMTWASNNPQVGHGTQEITATKSPSYLKTHLDFGGQGVADAAFNLMPEEGATKITWSLDTDMREGAPIWLQPINTYVGFFMDSMIGQDYEQGLQNLKDVAEG
ncbi:MAG: SRPBCC family protein [Leptolyngbyaceae cyanobacterium MO_188.B28]|nr:SRPBCC family protein [Leptolyngbyaceae cyanobacterium MO_188.B28]